MHIKYNLTVLFVLITIISAFPQNFPDNTLGNFRKLKTENQSIRFTTDNGQALVTIYSPEVVRIRISKAAFDDGFSYAVVASPATTPYKLTETHEMVIIRTDSLWLQVTKQPLRFTFFTKDGQAVVNEDDPAFGTTWIGEEVTTYKKLQFGEKFIGLGEKTGNLDRRGEGYVNWNSDTPGYTVNQDPIYASFPFYIGIHHNLVYGIFFDNSFKTYFNFGASNDRFSSFGADAGEMNYYFIGGHTIERIIENYTGLTGRMPMPPLWGLGFQQSRWSYFPDSQVMGIARTFRDKKIPLDVLYLDIHYMDAYKVFTWHPQRFSNPAQLTADLKKMGVHTAVIIDPGVKVEKGYAAFEEGVNQKMFITYPDGTNYTAQVWPGWCHFPDFTNPRVRSWWGDKFEENVRLGVTGFWNDMNEIASWGAGKSPSNLQLNWEGRGASYRQAKNVYGMLMARSTFEGTKKLMNARPLVLTRAAYSGAQRYTAIWTGDNVASEEHMMLGCRLVNSLGISGMPFCGTDVGGFMNGDATRSLFARWISLGTFTPFFRVHKNYDYNLSEPWSYGNEVETIARNYISLRYKLLPYLYSAFYQAHTTGIPVNRSLAINFTFDERCWYYAYQNQYLFGPSLLIAPVESTKELTKVYLPEGEWYDFFTGNKYNGNQEIMVECPLEKLPVFAKSGSFIPMQSVVQNTTEKPSDTLFVHFYLGNDPSEFLYYEDDGVSYAYESGEFLTRILQFNPSEKTIRIDAPKGTFRSKFHTIALCLHGLQKEQVVVNNVETSTIDLNIDFYSVLKSHDANYIPGKAFPHKVKTIVLAGNQPVFQIKW